MAVTLTHVGRRPGQTQFGLDTFTEIYKANAAADVVELDPGVPQKGDAHPEYPFMYVTDRYFNESGESACAADIIYMGCMKYDGEGNPILPPSQGGKANPIVSETSSRSRTGLFLDSPATVKFYAANNVLNYISYNAEGTDEATDPVTDPEIISVDPGSSVASTGYIPSDVVVDLFFSTEITSIIDSREIVAGKFWQNVATKSKALVPFVFDITPGTHILIGAPGTGYSIGDDLTISDGGQTAVIEVTRIGGAFSSGSGVVDFTITSSDFTTSTIGLVLATGGTGTGAMFGVIVIP